MRAARTGDLESIERQRATRSFADLSGDTVLGHPGNNLRPRIKPELAQDTS
jgi:hypothetical protein